MKDLANTIIKADKMKEDSYVYGDHFTSGHYALNYFVCCEKVAPDLTRVYPAYMMLVHDRKKAIRWAKAILKD